MSSTTSSNALSRARTLRKPTNTRPETTSGGGEIGVRNVSPSRLPVKGQTPASGTAPSATRTTRSATTSAGTARSSRPLSGVFARITSTSSRPREKDSPGPETSPPARPTRAASIRQSSVSTRSSTGATPATRPTTSSGVPTARRVASGASTGQGVPDAPRHARAKSSVTALSSATTLRPPSQTSTTSTSTTATTADRSRPPLTSLTRRAPGAATPPSPTTTTAPRRPLSLHAKTNSQQLNNKPLPAIPPSHPTTTTQPKTNLTQPKTNLLTHPRTLPTPTTTTTTTTSAGPGVTKPSFTTHQQHYTPLKPPAPKPLTSTFLAPPSPSKLPSNVALSAETARLQAELLQLCLLHREATSTRTEWEGSAKDILRGRFEGLKREDEGLREAEGAVAEGEGVASLLEWWGEGDGSRGLEERVMVLDGVVTGVWGVVGEAGGRYERVVRGFEGWVAGVERVLMGRRRRGGQQLNQEGQNRHNHRQEEEEEEEEEEEDPPFIPAPSPTWQAEHAALLRRAEEWRRQLDELPSVSSPPEQEGPPSTTSLGRILAGCRALVRGMLAELEVMQLIDREAAADEMAWVREMNRRGLDRTDEGTPRAGAIWRVL